MPLLLMRTRVCPSASINSFITSELCFCAPKAGNSLVLPPAWHRRQHLQTHREGVALQPEPPGLPAPAFHPGLGLTSRVEVTVCSGLPGAQPGTSPTGPVGFAKGMERAGVSAANASVVWLAWDLAALMSRPRGRVAWSALRRLQGRPSSAGLWGPGGDRLAAGAGRRTSRETGAKSSFPPHRGTSSGKASTPGILGLPCVSGRNLKGCSSSGKELGRFS